MSAAAANPPDAAAVFPMLAVEGYRPHALHASDRPWPETNCSVDLMIEVIAALGLPPQAALGFTLTQDFEGDQFTFFKMPPEDLEALYGLRLLELAIYDAPERHLAEQVGRGRLPLIEFDSFFLPDTRGISYGIEHGKTTIGVNRIDVAGRRLYYFHNAGYFALEGEDFEGVFQTASRCEAQPFLPYCEFLKLGEIPVDADALPALSMALLARHFAGRPKQNPLAAFAPQLAAQAEALYDRPAFFHKYAFNTLRQLGANFLLCADHLSWLEAAGYGDFSAERAAAMQISDTAKIVQFQLARAVTRRKAAALPALMEPAADSWEQLMAGLGRRL